MHHVYSLIHLGCPKNLIDTEKILGQLADNGQYITQNPEDSDVVLINTCGFIHSARQEARDNIKAMLKLKKQKKIKAVIVLGCFAKFLGDKLLQEYPDLDGVIGFCDYDNVTEQIQSILQQKTNLYITEENFIPQDKLRLRVTEPNYSYLRITEGCNNCCSYCTIPQIRGNMRSKAPEIIIEEAQCLIEDGATELIVIGQDTANYGTDIQTDLFQLVEKLCTLPKLKWLRVMYLHPGHFHEKLHKIYTLPRVLPYLEMPIQHINDEILAKMNRKNTTHQSIENTIQTLRKNIQNFVIRTTVMVGFPGETEEQFQELYQFLEKIKFDRLGAFIYSAEPNTPASKYENQIDPKVSQRRYDEVMKLQQKIAFQKNEQLLHKKLEVVIEEQLNKNMYRARSYAEAPEIDPLIYVQASKKLRIGKYYTVEIIKTKDYDLVGKI